MNNPYNKKILSINKNIENGHGKDNIKIQQDYHVEERERENEQIKDKDTSNPFIVNAQKNKEKMDKKNIFDKNMNTKPTNQVSIMKPNSSNTTNSNKKPHITVDSPNDQNDKNDNESNKFNTYNEFKLNYEEIEEEELEEGEEQMDV